MISSVIYLNLEKLTNIGQHSGEHIAKICEIVEIKRFKSAQIFVDLKKLHNEYLHVFTFNSRL